MSTIVSGAQCLVCDTPIEVALECEKGEIVECSGCGQEHEIVNRTEAGVQVELAPEVEEDWGE